MKIHIVLHISYIYYVNAIWDLHWSDEFNSDEIDRNKWTVIDKRLNHGKHYDTFIDGSNCYENITQSNGVLALTEINNNYLGKTFSEGTLISKKRFSLGKIEIRASMPQGEMLWTTIALKRSDDTISGLWLIYSRKGQIKNGVSNKWTINTHTYNVKANLNYFNNYSIEWSKYLVIWKLNDVETQKRPIWLTNVQEQFSLQITVGVGDPFNTNKPTSINGKTNWNCSSLLIDYVRYYKINYLATKTTKTTKTTKNTKTTKTTESKKPFIPNRNQICKSVNNLDCKWILKWQDNFESKQLDEKLWNIDEHRFNCESRFLNHTNCFTNQKHNLRHINGTLALTAVNEQYYDRNFTGAHVYTKHKFTFGKIEVRAAMSEAFGVWTLITLKRDNNEKIFNLTSVLNYERNKFVNGIHKTSSRIPEWKETAIERKNESLYDFNIYSIEWNKSVIIWKFNEKQTYLQNINGLLEDDTTFTLHIAIAVGGQLFHDHSVSKDYVKGWICPTLLIDYVRYYQLSNKETEMNSTNKQIPNRRQICSDVHYEESDQFNTISSVDLSHPLNNQTFHWPTSLPFQLRIIKNGTVERGNYKYWYQMDDIYMSTHTGTHLDAPCHFAKGKWSVAEIPLRNMIDLPVSVIDVVNQSIASPDYEMSIKDITKWEERNGKIASEGVILVRTGWAKFWPNSLKYLGTNTKNVSLLHFPGVHPTAAQWLTENRKIVGIGIDTASIDKGQSPDFMSHRIFLAKNIYLLENIAQTINELPAIGARLTLLPLKIEGASGVSVRLIAKMLDILG